MPRPDFVWCSTTGRWSAPAAWWSPWGSPSRTSGRRNSRGSTPELVSHTCEHAGLDKWRGKHVAVVGRGQSACESAVLLREAGAKVDLICRGEVHWIGVAPGDADQARDWRWRLRELLQAPSAVGPFPWSWLNELPGIERLLPDGLRSWIGARSLRAASARWVMPGLDGVQVLAGRAVKRVSREGERCRGRAR